MVDHQPEALEHLSQKLTSHYSIKTYTMSLDLTQSDTAPLVINQMKACNCRLMIYNAAYGPIMSFMDYSPAQLDATINVNIRSQIQLIHAFTTHTKSLGMPGGIVLMSSLAGLLGMQFIAPYAATKAFTWNLAESLRHELRPLQIDIIACIAGATKTEAYLKTKPRYGVIKPQVQEPAVVAKSALNNLGKKSLFISGGYNRISYFLLTRLLPRNLASRIVNKTMREMYPDL